MYKKQKHSGIGKRHFFFQAEDGIRDAQESRGHGDVYKRQDLWDKVQVKHSTGTVSFTHLTLPTILHVDTWAAAAAHRQKPHLLTYMSVSYTHLTLQRT